MKTLQQWFEKLAGISQDELDRITLAAQVFADKESMDFSRLSMPACWRRHRKVLTLG